MNKKYSKKTVNKIRDKYEKSFDSAEVRINDELDVRIYGSFGFGWGGEFELGEAKSTVLQVKNRVKNFENAINYGKKVQLKLNVLKLKIESREL